MEFPTKVRIVPTESQVKSSFRAGLKSRVCSSRRALADAEDFWGNGLPPGPVWSGGAGTTASLEAVAILWAVNATRKTTRRTIGEAK